MKPKKEEVKDVQIKARPQQKPMETKVPEQPKAQITKPTAVKGEASVPKTEAPKTSVKKASGQNNSGFFGRMFSKKRK